MYLYLIQNSLNGKRYIGITNDLHRRLIEHNTNNSHYTGKQTGSWILVEYIYFEDANVARREESRLKKSKNKKYIDWYFQKGRAPPT